MTSGHSHNDRDDRDGRNERDDLANDRLAQRARAAHTTSLDRLSPGVQAQLAQRRRTAIKQETHPAAGRAWPMLALGSAAALTLAVGLFALRNSGEADPTTPTQTATTAPASAQVPTPAADTATETTPAPASAIAANDTANDITDDARDDAVIDALLAEASLPEELLAAEFDVTDADIGFDGMQEPPEFYLWLGSQEGQADVTESL
jgi:hypothetical protein